MEIWVDIKGYEGLYQVSNFGRVKSLSRLIPMINHNTGKKCFRKTKDKIKSIGLTRGYNSVNLSKCGHNKTHRLCRLVATHFIENTHNKPHVNHKDGNKLNDIASNLEWVTPSENMRHAKDNGLLNCKSGKNHKSSMRVVNKITGEYYHSIKDAAKRIGIDPSVLSRKLRGVYKNDTDLVYG